MKLRHKEIPVEFFRNLPEGIKIVKRHGKEFMVVERALGPNGEDLISPSVHIHGEPSIRLAVRIGADHGFIFVDSFWGSHAKLFSFVPAAIDETSEVDAYVADTGASLMIDRPCSIEGCTCRRSIMFNLGDGKSSVYVCARLGCPGHAVEFAGLPRSIAETIGSINFFGAGNMDESWFDEF